MPSRLSARWNYLSGKSRPARLLHEVTMALCVELLLTAGLADSESAANTKHWRGVFDNGQRQSCLQKMVAGELGRAA
jgi:thymidine phosphorylase